MPQYVTKLLKVLFSSRIIIGIMQISIEGIDDCKIIGENK